MANWLTIQYQNKAEPPAQSGQPGQSNAAPWLYPWSEPVRQSIKPALAIALAASGAFAPVPFNGIMPGPIESTYHQGWSEPVRVKPALQTGIQQTLAFHPTPIVPNDWRQWLSEPIRLKPGLIAALQRFEAIDAQIPPNVNTTLQGYNWWSEPVRDKPGLKAHYQQFLAYHPRMLPTPDVTATMAAIEVNNDEFLGAINVYDSGGSGGSAGAKVSVVEISAITGDPVSIEES